MKARYISLPEEEKPSDVEAFIKAKGLAHGDVVHFDDDRSERDENSYIVKKETDESSEVRFVWIKNPNETQCDFLTIPITITRSMPEAPLFYLDIIKDRPAMNVHVSPRDRWVRSKFGAVPEEWVFDLFYEDGELNQVSLKIPKMETEYDIPLDQLNAKFVEKYR